MASRREQTLLTFTILVILVVGGYFLVNFGFGWWKGLDQRILDLQKAILKAQTTQNEMATVEERFKKMEIELNLGSNLAATDKQAILNREVDSLLIRSGLSKESLTPVKWREEDDFRVLLVQVKDVQGSAANFGKFFWMLENDSSVLSIEDLQLNNPMGSGRPGRDRSITASMRISRLVEYGPNEERPTSRRRRSGLR